MNVEPLDPNFRSGFVAVIGRPNVGKSTLLNALLGQKVAIVSPKPQTTRRTQLGIYTTEQAQIIFVDTPGLLRPRRSLDRYMVTVARAAIDDADVVLWIVDVTQTPGSGDRHIARLIADGEDKPLLLALNKSDRLPPEAVLPRTNAYCQLVPGAEWMLVSATRGDNLDKLLAQLIAALPKGPQYYPADHVTQTQIRDLAAEFVREAALHHLRDEAPHGVAVEIEEFDEASRRTVHILANVYVERESHKGIIIGKHGRMLKKIGTRARQEIEALLVDRPVYLELHVKVRAGWRSSDQEVRRMGYRNGE